MAARKWPSHGLILLIPPLRARAPSPNVRRRGVTPVSPGRGLLEVADLDDATQEEEEEESNDDVRVLASAHCCRRRGGDATINIRWEVGRGRVTQGRVEVVAVVSLLTSQSP